jgi:hypothetical protein
MERWVIVSLRESTEMKRKSDRWRTVAFASGQLAMSRVRRPQLRNL